MIEKITLKISDSFALQSFQAIVERNDCTKFEESRERTTITEG